MSPAKLRHALFDMDGLLLDSERLCLDSMINVGGPFGVTEPEALFLRCVGTRSDETARIVTEAVGEAAPAFLGAWDQDIKARFAQGIPLKPGAREALEALAGQGVTMAVVTSTRQHSAERHLARAGLEGFFLHVQGGDISARPKPAPDPYLEAAARLGVDPRACVAFEDSNTGVRAARSAGCVTIQVPDLAPPIEEPEPPRFHIAATLEEAVARSGLL